jgi:small Trp-rich protein
MWFLGIGVVIFAWQWYRVGPVYNWTWEQLGWISIPFILAILWWSWADWSGYTKRKAMERENARKEARVEKHREQLRGPRR